MFVLQYILVYGAMHVYSLLRAGSPLNVTGAALSLSIIVLSVLGVVAPMMIHRLAKRGADSRTMAAAARIGYSWMGTLFLFCIMSLGFDLFNLVFGAATAVAGTPVRASAVPFPWDKTMTASLLCVTGALALYAHAEASVITRKRLTIETDKLPEGTDRIRIVQVSDVHLGYIVRRKRAEKIARAVAGEDPDVVVSTGDMVDAKFEYLSGLDEPFRNVRPRLGKYAILGNHEAYIGVGNAERFLSDSGFTVLRNGSVTVGGAIRVAGMDDPATGEPASDRTVSGSGDAFTVLLKHRPVADAEAGFDLMLSGHTHGGQIFPFHLISKAYFPYVAGTHRLPGGKTLHVSRGTGTWGPPMRLMTPPEVTVIDVVRAGAA